MAVGKMRRTRGTDRNPSRKMKAKSITRHYDQVFDDVKDPKRVELKEPDADLPGMGKYYCIPCARHFISKAVLDDHIKQRPHRRRVKQLQKEKPYRHEDAERAAGMAPADNGVATKSVSREEKMEN